MFSIHDVRAKYEQVAEATVNLLEMDAVNLKNKSFCKIEALCHKVKRGGTWTASDIDDSCAS